MLSLTPCAVVAALTSPRRNQYEEAIRSPVALERQSSRHRMRGGGLRALGIVPAQAISVLDLFRLHRACCPTGRGMGRRRSAHWR